jgi:hypothetical protein
MQRVQMWMLVFTGLWLLALVSAIWLVLTGGASPATSIDDLPWYHYPPFDPNWELDLGLSLAPIAVWAAGVDGFARLVVLAVGEYLKRNSARNIPTPPAVASGGQTGS